MADIVDRETRSRMMAAIRSKNTGPELRLRRLLWESGLRGYRLHRKDLPGSPDVAWVGRKVAVFVDGAFWHGHPDAFTPGKSGQMWDEKIRRNQERDARVDRELAERGWIVIRVWDFELDSNPGSVVRRIARAHRSTGVDLKPPDHPSTAEVSGETGRSLRR